MSRLSHKQKLYIIVGIAAVAVVLQYLLHLKLYAQILVTLVGAIIALSKKEISFIYKHIITDNF